VSLNNYLYQRLRAYLQHEPTSDQEALLLSLAEFIADADTQNIFMLTGYAGTGKTTVVAALVKLLKEIETEALLLAPTGRAAKVLSNYSGESAFTIHKKIYRQKVRNDVSSAFVLAPNEYLDTLFIVDEASMISNESQGSIFGSGRLLDDLTQFIRSGEGCKLLIVGDTAQLPPVHSPLSPALNPDVLSRYGSTEHHKLTTVVRQAAQSGILYNATAIRKNIENNIIAFPKIQTAGFNDIEHLSGNELLEKLTEAYDKYGERETMVICRSNKRANIYNNGIRSRLLFREEELLRGDRLMIVKNCYQFLENTEKLDFIANGDIAELVNIRRHEERYGLRFARAELRFPDYDDVEITAKIMLDTLHLETPSLDAGRQTMLYEGVLADNAHIKTKLERNKAVREDPYYNALQIRYANAITCHKAQGGQWKAIFLDYPFRQEMLPTLEDLRWLYTAFTRATECLYLVNFPQV